MVQAMEMTAADREAVERLARSTSAPHRKVVQARALLPREPRNHRFEDCGDTERFRRKGRTSRVVRRMCSTFSMADGGGASLIESPERRWKASGGCRRGVD